MRRLSDVASVMSRCELCRPGASGRIAAVAIHARQAGRLAIVLAFVDRGVGVVVAPVEPIVFERRDALETFSLCRTGDGATLEVPLASGVGVEQPPVFVIGLQKEFCVFSVDAA